MDSQSVKFGAEPNRATSMEEVKKYSSDILWSDGEEPKLPKKILLRLNSHTFALEAQQVQEITKELDERVRHSNAIKNGWIFVA